jgi:hypothetical protein
MTDNEAKDESRLKAILVTMFIIVVLVCALLVSTGCRSKMTTQYYESGKVQSQTYEEGFHFFSDGAGKVISPEINLSAF